MQEKVEPGEYYHGKRVLVTGGLGFIGSNLVRRLAGLGASITVIDACFPDQGANLFNLKDVLDELVLVVADIGSVDEISAFIVDQEIIFNLASCVSHIDSLRNPLRDLERNCLSQLRFLNCLTELSPCARIIYTGSRSQYGNPVYVPIDEDHPLRPLDINGVHKTAAEEYHRIFHEQGNIRYTSLRLTNIYGPRHQMHHDGQGFLNWFIRQGLTGQEICVYGGGEQERDFLYVEDVVDALLRVAPDERCEGRVFNVVSGIPITVAQAAAAICDITDNSWRCVAYPPERSAVEPGNIRLDGSRLQVLTGWMPRYGLQAGLRETVDFYRQHGHRYFHGPKGNLVLSDKGME
ncbi:MAG: NAD-dependent epimerase/dehydratase family protein [Actinobacteria bacterium]|jgi:UDP-glucose 4-epimerase|nr:MAG: NAD-dependent epimerase/dehydratase family protein [Actinomycetota bacterium]